MEKQKGFKLLIIPTIYFCVLLCMIFFISIPVHAQGVNLPYIVEEDLPYPIEDLKSLWDNYVNVNFGGNDFLNTDWTHDIIVYSIPEGSSFTHYNVLVPCANSSYSISLNGIPYVDFNIENNYITIGFTNYVEMNYRLYSDGRFVFYGTNNTGNFSRGFFSSYPTPIYISNSFNWGDYVVLSLAPPLVVGFPTAPNFSANLGADIGANIPNLPQTPTYTTYNYTLYSPPTFDNSSVLNAIESVGDILQYSFSWLADNIKGSIDNLKNNIKSSIDYIGQLIEYTTRKIIDNIQNGIQNLYDNFVSLFQPMFDLLIQIKEKLDYISEPFSKEDITDAFESGSIYSDFSDLKDFIDNAFGIFGDTSEPNDYTIPIHLENIPILHCGIQYIDLSIINPVKNILRAFMWCITTFGLLYTICDALPNYLSGGDE